MRGLPPQLRFVPLLLGLLVLIAAVAWSGRVAPRARAIAPAPTPVAAVEASPAPTAPVAVAAPVARATQARPHAVAEAGMRAYIDPETGTLGPPVSDDGSNAIIDTGEGLVEERLPNGAVKIDLKGQFQEYAVVQLDANGHPVMRCVPNPKLALKNGVAPAAAPVER